MSFKPGIVAFIHSNLISWKAELNEDGEIVITVRDDRPLEYYYESLKTMVWFILAEIPHKAELVRIIVTSKSRSKELDYVFDPKKRGGG